MDDRERDQFYSSSSDEAGEDDEYEVEPPDPDVLSGEQHRAQETIESTRMSIDIDEIYRDAERDRGREILEGWFRNFPVRFQIKHLLIATAVLAILLTLYKLGLMAVVVVAVMLSIAGLYLYLQWQDKQQQAEADRRRQEMYARRRAHLGKQSQGADATTAAEENAAPLETAPPIANEIDEAWQQARAGREFHFRFSMQQLLAAMTAAGVIFGLVQMLGGPANAATLLGLFALFGLIVHALGYEPPETVVLGWWLILVLYVLLSIAGAVWSGVT
jgi:hypothetical protein